MRDAAIHTDNIDKGWILAELGFSDDLRARSFAEASIAGAVPKCTW